MVATNSPFDRHRHSLEEFGHFAMGLFDNILFADVRDIREGATIVIKALKATL